MATFTGPEIATDKLILCLDASNPKSYPGTGGFWYDLSNRNNHFKVNSTAYSSSEGGFFNFQNPYGYAKTVSNADVKDSNGNDLEGDVTYIALTRVKNSTAEWRTLTRSYSADHHVIIQAGAWNVGMYDNNSVGFLGTGFDQRNLPGYNTFSFDFMCWRWSNNDTPTYDFSVNNVQRGTISNSNARYNRGFGILGGYHNGSTDINVGSQPWGDINYFAVYDKRLTDEEVTRCYKSLRLRYGL
jgi:hypothetical protein